MLGTSVVLLAVVFVLNFHRFVLGIDGPLQKTDVADQYIDKFRYCGAWLTSPATYQWNPSALRGWPTLYGSINPQHPGCFLAAVLPTPYVFPVLHVLVQALVIVGSFLFLSRTLALSRSAPLYGAVLNLGIYYFHNENPFVAQVALVPLLAFLTSAQSRPLPAWLRAAGLILITMLSFPFYTLPLMLIAHVAVVLFVGHRRRANLKWAGAFWLAFGLFYAPALFYYISHGSSANRSFFHFGFEAATFGEALGTFVSKGILYPELVTVVLMDRKVILRLLAGGGVALAIAVWTAFQQSVAWASLTGVFPGIVVFNPRVFYFISLVVFLLASVLIEVRHERAKRLARFAAVVAFSLILTTIVYPRARQLAITSGALALWWGCVLLVDPLRTTGSRLRQLVVVCVLLLPSSLIHAATVESLPYGNLFLSEERYPAVAQPGRVVTMTATCYPFKLYPAQVSVQGRETLDGFSVFYDRGFAERWWWYVTRGSTGCTREFFYWNNRVELVLDDFLRRPDLVLQWLRVNNVLWIRSDRPLNHPELQLHSEIRTPRSAARWSFCRLMMSMGFSRACGAIWRGNMCGRCQANGDEAGCDACFEAHYLYAIKQPFPRVFGLRRSPALDAVTRGSPDLDAEAALLRGLGPDTAAAVELDSYTPSRLEFHGDFAGTAFILASVNAVEGWRVFVDGKDQSSHLGLPVFGMLTIHPFNGPHRYVLRFDDRSLLYVALCSVLGTAGLVILSAAVSRAR